MRWLIALALAYLVADLVSWFAPGPRLLGGEWEAPPKFRTRGGD